MPTVADSPPPLRWSDLPGAPAPGTPLLHRDAIGDGQVLLHTLAAANALPASQPFSVLLLRSGTAVHAFVNRCAHFGVPLAARQKQLLFQPHTSLSCNVHYALYRWSDGLCVKGDCAGESLLPLPVVVDADGCVCVGT